MNNTIKTIITSTLFISLFTFAVPAFAQTTATTVAATATTVQAKQTSSTTGERYLAFQERMTLIMRLMEIIESNPSFANMVRPIIVQAIQTLMTDVSVEVAKTQPQKVTEGVTPVKSTDPCVAGTTANYEILTISTTGSATKLDPSKPCVIGTDTTIQKPTTDKPTEKPIPDPKPSQPGLHIGSMINIYTVSGYSQVKFHRPFGFDEYTFQGVTEVNDIVNLIDQAQPNYTAQQIADHINSIRYYQS